MRPMLFTKRLTVIRIKGFYCGECKLFIMFSNCPMITHSGSAMHPIFFIIKYFMHFVPSEIMSDYNSKLFANANIVAACLRTMIQ